MKSKNPSGRKVVKKWAVVFGDTLLDVPIGREEQMESLRYWRSQTDNPYKAKLVPCTITYKSK